MAPSLGRGDGARDALPQLAFEAPVGKLPQIVAQVLLTALEVSELSVTGPALEKQPLHLRGRS